EFPVILLAPELRFVRDIYQFGLYVEGFAPLDYSACENCADIQIPADRRWINLLPLVTKDGAAGHYAQFGQLREAVDDALCNAVAQVVHVRILIRIGKGEDGKGVDRFGVAL